MVRNRISERETMILNTMYSASVMERATIGWCLDIQETTPESILTMNVPVEHPESLQPP